MSQNAVIALYCFSGASLITGFLFFTFFKKQTYLKFWREHLKGGMRVTFTANERKLGGKIGYVNPSTQQYLVVPDDSNYQQFFCDPEDLHPES
jgi:hypothetical protein